MRGGAIWGLALIALGLIILLGNLGYHAFGWDVVWRLWPTVLIYMGLVRIFRYVRV